MVSLKIHSKKNNHTGASKKENPGGKSENKREKNPLGRGHSVVQENMIRRKKKIAKKKKKNKKKGKKKGLFKKRYGGSAIGENEN